MTVAKLSDRRHAGLLEGQKKAALAPDARTTFNFVVQSNKPFTKTKVTVTRIVLEGGKLADVNKDLQVESLRNRLKWGPELASMQRRR